FRTHQNRPEDIIQVMGYATRQCANAFKSLGAQQLHFKFFLLADVRVDVQDRTRSSVRIAHDGRSSIDKDLSAILRDLPEFAAKFPGRAKGSRCLFVLLSIGVD